MHDSLDEGGRRASWPRRRRRPFQGARRSQTLRHRIVRGRRLVRARHQDGKADVYPQAMAGLARCPRRRRGRRWRLPPRRCRECLASGTSNRGSHHVHASAPAAGSPFARRWVLRRTPTTLMRLESLVRESIAEALEAEAACGSSPETHTPHARSTGRPPPRDARRAKAPADRGHQTRWSHASGRRSTTDTRARSSSLQRHTSIQFFLRLRRHQMVAARKGVAYRARSTAGA